MPGTRPCLRRRRDSAEPSLGRSETTSLTRSPATARQCSGRRAVAVPDRRLAGRRRAARAAPPIQVQMKVYLCVETYTNAAMLLIAVGLRTPLYATICVVYLAICAFVITEEPPFVIALTIVASGSDTLSRFGPMLLSAPAAFSVWHAEHVVRNSALPALGFPISFGAAVRCAS